MYTTDLKILDGLEKNGMEFGMKYKTQGFEWCNRYWIKMEWNVENKILMNQMMD